MKKLILIAIIAAAIVLSGCKQKEHGQDIEGAKELLLYCGAGIRPATDELVTAFEQKSDVKIVIDYAGSEVLLSKIRLARRGDLYMPGDKYYVDKAKDEDMVLTQRSVCYWVPTILVQKGNPKNITGLKDLFRPGIRIGVGDASACAIGRTTANIFSKNNITPETIEKNLKYKSLTVNELGMQIQAKALDAVIVWDAMAHYYSKHGEQVPIPVEKNVISTVDIGILKFTKNKEMAGKFVDFLSSKQGQQIFEKHNYRTKLPE